MKRNGFRRYTVKANSEEIYNVIEHFFSELNKSLNGEGEIIRIGFGGEPMKLYNRVQPK